MKDFALGTDLSESASPNQVDDAQAPQFANQDKASDGSVRRRSRLLRWGLRVLTFAVGEPWVNALRNHLGLGVAGTAIYYLLTIEAQRQFVALDQNRFLISGVLIGFGIVLETSGRLRRRRILAPEHGDTTHTESGWWTFGPGLLLFAGVLFFLATPILQTFARTTTAIPKPQSLSIQAPAAVPAPQTNAPSRLPEVAEYFPPPLFPIIKIRGTMPRLARPAALVNGETLFVGDCIEGARLIKISAQGITLEMEHEVRTYEMGW